MFCPTPRWGAYSAAPQTPGWSARNLWWLRHSHIQNLNLISDHRSVALHLPYRHLAIYLPLAQRKQRIGDEIAHYLSFFSKKQSTIKRKKWSHKGRGLAKCRRRKIEANDRCRIATAGLEIRQILRTALLIVV